MKNKKKKNKKPAQAVGPQFKKTAAKFLYVDRAGRFINTNPHPRAKTHLKTRLDKDGYERISAIYEGTGKRTDIPVHRLVAMAHVNGYKPGLVVNHKNGIKTDNRAENLDWMTAADNERHARRVLGKRLVGEKASRSKLMEFQVTAIRWFVDNGCNAKQIERWFSISQTQVSRIIRRKNWSHI